jgi:ABC-type polysaccharide/polyol phosphate transport system ATPase subunit
VADFCTRAVWLDQGQVRMQGKARDVASEYAIFMDSPD